MFQFCQSKSGKGKLASFTLPSKTLHHASSSVHFRKSENPGCLEDCKGLGVHESFEKQQASCLLDWDRKLQEDSWL